MDLYRQCPLGRPDAFELPFSDAFDNATRESNWPSMHIELLDRKRMDTRAELSNAIFRQIELFYNCRRRHSALGCASPIGFERPLV
ncbi:MAG TPA: IS3 family transposase [Acidimicrobiales bacterium]|nr:IS3 family transposase [Acidimicrobiales bacterium]